VIKIWRSAYCERCDKLGFDKCFCPKQPFYPHLILSRRRKTLPFDTSTPAERAGIVGANLVIQEQGQARVFIVQHAACYGGRWYLQYGETETGVPGEN